MQVRRPTTGEDLAPAEVLLEPPDQLLRADGGDGVQEDTVGITGDADSTPTTEEVAVTDWSVYWKSKKNHKNVFGANRYSIVIVIL